MTPVVRARPQEEELGMQNPREFADKQTEQMVCSGSSTLAMRAAVVVQDMDLIYMAVRRCIYAYIS